MQQALELGYSVRGTARSQDKADATKKVHNNHPKYSTTIVTDFGKSDEEIKDAVKGVNAIIHVASDTGLDNDPNVMIPAVVRATEVLLEAAAKEPSVKRFVLTSSSSAALTPKPNVDQTATVDSWNNEAVDVAFNKKGQNIGPNPYGFIVYAASKTQGERALWKFMKEQKPGFVANSVLPNFNIGTILGSAGVTAAMVLNLYQKGEKLPLPPRKYNSLSVSRLDNFLRRIIC